MIKQATSQIKDRGISTENTYSVHCNSAFLPNIDPCLPNYTVLEPRML